MFVDAVTTEFEVPVGITDATRLGAIRAELVRLLYDFGFTRVTVTADGVVRFRGYRPPNPDQRETVATSGEVYFHSDARATPRTTATIRCYYPSVFLTVCLLNTLFAAGFMFGSIGEHTWLHALVLFVILWTIFVSSMLLEPPMVYLVKRAVGAVPLK